MTKFIVTFTLIGGWAVERIFTAYDVADAARLAFSSLSDREKELCKGVRIAKEEG